MNNLAVRLPIEIEDAQRAHLKGLVLYVKEGVQGAWNKVDQGVPQQTEFICRVPREGEYWFRIVAIDSQGRPQPADLNKDLQDAVVVVVDVTAPTVDVHFAGVTNDGTLVQCDVHDANLDPLQTHFFFQTQDQVWRPLDAVPGRAGLFCIPRQAVLTNMVKVSAADLGHNATNRVYNLGELAQAGRGSASASQTAANSQAPIDQQQLPPPIAPVVPNPVPPAPPSGPLVQSPYAAPQNQVPQITTSTPPTKSTGGAITMVSETWSPGEEVRSPRDVNPQVRPASTTRSFANRNDPTTVRPGTTSETTAPTWPTAPIWPTVPTAPTAPTGTTAPTGPTVAGTLARQATAPAQIVGSPTVLVNYEFENLGASGVGKFEIWATSDQGRTWIKMVDDPTRKNPAEIRFPGEGVFGLKLVASNGRGYGAEPPQSGDPADCWIEVDTTKPKAEIIAVQAGTGPESGVLTVFWKAEDKNLASDGIDLYYATSTEGPWTAIAKNVHNDKGNEGQYRWTPPTQAGAQSYLRLVVRDRAGNSAISQTVQPIPLDDLSRPRVHLLGVSTSAAQPTPAVAASLSAPAALRPGIVRPVQATSIPDLAAPVAGPNLIGVESR